MELELDAELAHFRSLTFSDNTKKSYNSYKRSYLQFCTRMGYPPTPISTQNLCRYTVYLARRLQVSSIKKYLNIVRLLHLEGGFPNPIKDNWMLTSLISGISREKGLSVRRKVPITPDLLLRIKQLLNFNDLQDTMFWAASLTAFFGFFRKSNLFPPSNAKFDPEKHLTRADFTLFSWGIQVTIKWTKTIQYKDRTLFTPLPRLPGHPLCPVEAIVRALAMSTSVGARAPAFVISHNSKLISFPPARFVSQLRSLLSRIGVEAANFSGHSFRRGAASWALQNGLPGDIIKILGDWKSEAYFSYLTLDQQSKVNSINMFARPLPTSSR